MVMAQWPYSVMPTASNKMEVPLTIPEEWEKANKALQAVQKPKPPSPSSNNTKPNLNPNPVVGYQFPYSWQQPMYSYPGYPNYAAPPNFSFYPNYQNFNMMNSNRMFMPMSMSMQNSSSPGLNNNGLSHASNSEEKLLNYSELLFETSEQKLQTSTSNINKDSEISPPLPPQPPSPPPPEPISDGFKHSNKQAPGVDGIKFCLPKKFPKRSFQFQNNDKLYPKFKDSFHNNNQKSLDLQHNPDSPNNQKKHAQKSIYAVPQDRWPPSLRRYAKEAFLKCKSDVDKDQVEIVLKGKLIAATRDATIFTKDWDLEPLPNIHSERLEIELDKVPPVKNQNSKSPQTPPSRHSQEKKNYSFSDQRNYFRRSRSPSWSPPRKPLRKKKYSRSNSSGSSSDSRSSKKHLLSSRVISPTESKSAKKFNNTPKNKKKKKKNKTVFAAEPEFSTNEALQKRAARFESSNKKSKNTNIVLTISNPFIVDDFEDMDWGADAVIGTCEDLEKPFLRLTGAVDPSTVRPEEVLVKSLRMVKDHYRNNQDYNYACKQLKSIRQDLVVQCIRNRFTVEVYETHARIALEKGDKTEFNQCQSQLKSLYKETGEGNRLEFTGYHILYNIFTENNIELKNILYHLSEGEKKNEVVSHALKITSAWVLNNYHRFFKLYVSAPKMSGFVIDWFIERIRKSALKACIKSYVLNFYFNYVYLVKYRLNCLFSLVSIVMCFKMLTNENFVAESLIADGLFCIFMISVTFLISKNKVKSYENLSSIKAKNSCNV